MKRIILAVCLAGAALSQLSFAGINIDLDPCQFVKVNVACFPKYANCMDDGSFCLGARKRGAIKVASKLGKHWCIPKASQASLNSACNKLPQCNGACKAVSLKL